MFGQNWLGQNWLSDQLKLAYNFIDVAFAVMLTYCLFEKYLDYTLSLRGRFSKRVARSADVARRSFIADMLLPVKRSNDLHANLDEVEPLWVAAHGIRRARWIRRSQELQAIAKYWVSPLKDAFQAVLKIIR